MNIRLVGIVVAVVVAFLCGTAKYGGEFSIVFVSFEPSSGDDPVVAFSQSNLMKLPTELRRHLCGPPFVTPVRGDASFAVPEGRGVTLLLCGSLEGGDWLENPRQVIERAAGVPIIAFEYTVFGDDHGCQTPNSKVSAAMGHWLDVLGLRPTWSLALHMWNTGTRDDPPQMAVAGAEGARRWICPGYFWPLIPSDKGSFQVLYAGTVRTSTTGLTYVAVRGIPEKTKAPGSNGTIFKDVVGQFYTELAPLL